MMKSVNNVGLFTFAYFFCWFSSSKTGSASPIPHSDTWSPHHHPICRHIPTREDLLAITDENAASPGNHSDEPRIVNQIVSVKDYEPGQITLVSALYDSDDTIGHKERYYVLQVITSDDAIDNDIGRFKSATNGIKLKHCNGMTVFVDKNDVTEEGISFRWFAPYTYKGPVDIFWGVVPDPEILYLVRVSRITEVHGGKMESHHKKHHKTHTKHKND